MRPEDSGFWYMAPSRPLGRSTWSHMVPYDIPGDFGPFQDISGPYLGHLVVIRGSFGAILIDYMSKKSIF